jgi:hypothetical protein
VSVLNIDRLDSDGLYGLHELQITGNYRSPTGGKDIDLNGFDVEVLSSSRLRFWMVNNRPAVDQEGNFLDAAKVGANCTIEVFEHIRGSKNLEFIKTIHNDAIPSPNNVATTGRDSIFITNDHTNRVGTVHSSSFSLIALTIRSSDPSKPSSEQAPSPIAASTVPAQPPSQQTSNTPTASSSPLSLPTSST